MLGIGVDIVRTSRFREILARRPQRLERLCQRILHPEERATLTQENMVQKLASAWAAKEALYKSLGPDQSQCRFNEWQKCWRNNRYELVSDKARSDTCLVSISHDGDYTIAMVSRLSRLD